jgi:PetM family of cytochrome b6f complex subunit 7
MASEIFTIAAVCGGMVLLGMAIGVVLLKVQGGEG